MGETAPAYAIEKNVPLPAAKAGRRAGATVNTLRLMKAGDSFFVSGKKARNFGTPARRLGMKVATRREGDGVRVWCLEPAVASPAR